MTKRGEIVEAVKNQLKNILLANGYNTDIGQNIQEWRVSPLEALVLPVVILEDHEEIFNDEEAIIGDKYRELTILIKILAEIQNSIEEDLRLMVADVFKALGEDETLGDKVNCLDVKSVQIDVEQGKERLAMANITVIAEYDSQRWEF